MTLYSNTIQSILDEYDEKFDIYKSYKNRLLFVLEEVFNKTTIPIHSISSKLMSRGSLRNKFLEKGVVYESLDQVDNLISIQIVTYFSDDINIAASMVSREFLLKNIPLSKADEENQARFGIPLKRFSLGLTEENYNRIEYERFSSIKVELKIRSALLNSWFEVKDIFDKMTKADQISAENVGQLAQVSYLLKMADAELVRIRASLVKNRGVNDTKSSLTKEISPKNRAVTKDNGKEGKKEEKDEAVRLFERERHSRLVKEIEKFILNDRMVRELDREIADYYNTKLMYSGDFVSSLAYMLIRIKLDAIMDIKTDLRSNKHIIMGMMKYIFGDTSKVDIEFINKGSTLIVLFYIIIAQTGNVEVIKNHIKNVVDLNGMSVDDFANNLLFYYKKCV